MKSLDKIGMPIFQKKAHGLKSRLEPKFFNEKNGLYERLGKKDIVYAWHWEYGLRRIPPELQEKTLAETLRNDLSSPPIFRKPEESDYSHICVYYHLSKVLIVFKIQRSSDFAKRLEEHIKMIKNT